MEDALEGQGRAESGLLDDAPVLESGPHRGDDEDHRDDRDGGRDLPPRQPAHRGDEEEGAEGAREDEEEGQHRARFQEKIETDPAHPREGDEKRGEDEGETPNSRTRRTRNISTGKGPGARPAG